MRSGGDEARELGVPERAGAVDRARAEELVLALVGSQADSLLRVARRYSLCTDDAHDAYQRGLEILMRHAARLDPDRAAGWLHTVVKHEALAINRSRRRMLGSADVDLDALEARTSASPEERALSSDRVARSAEALHGLKPQEVRALWLKALGHSYEQICEVTGWSYTKVNRCLAEGRKSFLERYARIESGRECERLAPTLSAFVDGEAEGAQVVELRRHLRGCLACRAAVRGLHDASTPLGIVLPAVGLAAAGGGAEHASSLFVRVYETMTMQLNERAAHSFLRAQAIIDTVTAGKMAAAAASAAAMAGGGVAVEGALHASGDRPAAILRHADGGAAAATSSVKQPAGTRTKSAKHARRVTTGGSAPRERTYARGPGSSRQHASTTPARSSGPPPSPPSPPKSGSVAAAAGAGSTRSGAAAAAEFGFE
jgi:RNA polymerase sigma factor (sigma-70 family)